MLAPSSILSAIVAATLLSGAVADNTLGGLNMQACCQEQYSNGSEQAITDGSGCDDWQCYNPNTGNVDGGINVSECCQVTYSNGAAYSGCSGGEYGWTCYAP
ncbi:hypothetical protein FP744_10007211 [Trichoderma asperellum]